MTSNNITGTKRTLEVEEVSNKRRKVVSQCKFVSNSIFQGQCTKYVCEHCCDYLFAFNTEQQKEKVPVCDTHYSQYVTCGKCEDKFVPHATKNCKDCDKIYCNKCLSEFKIPLRPIMTKDHNIFLPQDYLCMHCFLKNDKYGFCVKKDLSFATFSKKFVPLSFSAFNTNESENETEDYPDIGPEMALLNDPNSFSLTSFKSVGESRNSHYENGLI